MRTNCYILIVLACATVLVSGNPVVILESFDTVTKVPHLLGESSCTWGPTYWCSNITNAKSCNAVKHCIKSVWEKQTLPPDNDSVCEVCTKMVKQARDQLQSNETQEELKEVFEGSCKLIPLKIISDECMNLVDEFVPELVETLASQMNPQVVCSVAGLCNNPRIDALLLSTKVKKSYTDQECDNCHVVVNKMREKFDAATKDQILQGFLSVCGRMGSFSDGCTNIILTHFEFIYNHIQQNLHPEQFCVMAGACYLQFHTHVNVEITPLSELGKVDPTGDKDSLPCKFCEQLVKHLRDLLVANTTEEEFEQILQGICKQTGNFKDECLGLVDQYYPEIYNYLVKELDANQICLMIGICPVDKSNSRAQYAPHFPYAPLLPLETVEKSMKILGSELSPKSKPTLARVKLTKSESNVRVIGPETLPMVSAENAQLPIERLLPPALTLSGNTKFCALCQYVLHFIQEEVTNPKNEDHIKQVVEHICEKLPRTISTECIQFVDQYGDAVIALIVQEIDPSQICPLLSLCPTQNLQEVEVLIHSKPKDKPTCPLCLFAVTQLEEVIKNHKTEESIRHALNGLCKHLPHNLAPECEDFVQEYTNELVEMLIADLSPQEVCVYLKLCNATKATKAVLKQVDALPHVKSNAELELTNEIPDNTVEGKPVSRLEAIEKARSPQCVICEFVMSQIEKELKDRKNEEHVKHLVHNVCNHLPKSVSKECNDFVDKYADLVIQLLVQTMEPSEICSTIGLCSQQKLKVAEEVFECAICETTVTTMDKLLENPNIDHNVGHVLKKACLALPPHTQEKCQGMIAAYGHSFYKLIKQLEDSRSVCNRVGLCANKTMRPKRQVGQNKCTYGPAFWCTEEAKAHKCAATPEYCQKYFASQRGN